MTISYIDQETRDLCYSLINNKGPFTMEEIVNIRAHIADLRAAQSLADAPIDYSIIEDSTSFDLLKVEFGKVCIFCRIITTIANPKPNQIKRVQILQVIKTDLQVPNRKLKNL